MKTRSKVLIAGAIAATLGGLALAGTSYAHRVSQGQHMGDGMQGGQGMHGMSGMQGGQGMHGMAGMHGGQGMHGMAGMHGGQGMHGMKGGHMRAMAARQFFKTADANEDGKVTQAEIDKALADRLARHDANKDGKLSLAEFEGVWLETSRLMMVRRFQHLDPDGDAAITGKELGDRFGKLVERFDRDGDGALSRKDRHHRMGGESKKPEGDD